MPSRRPLAGRAERVGLAARVRAARLPLQGVAAAQASPRLSPPPNPSAECRALWVCQPCCACSYRVATVKTLGASPSPVRRRLIARSPCACARSCVVLRASCRARVSRRVRACSLCCGLGGGCVARLSTSRVRPGPAVGCLSRSVRRRSRRCPSLLVSGSGGSSPVTYRNFL